MAVPHDGVLSDTVPRSGMVSRVETTTAYLAERAARRAKGNYRPLVMNALRQLRHHIAKPRSPARESLWNALWSLEQSQNEHRRVKWTMVREIHSSPALVVEYAVRIVIRPRESSYWGYRLAAYYAQRYDPSYGTGLIPASRPALEEIIRDWSRYIGGRGPGLVEVHRREGLGTLAERASPWDGCGGGVHVA